MSRVLPGRLAPDAMFPAGDPRFRVHYLRTAAGVHVRVVETGPPHGEPVFVIPGWACSAFVYRFLLAAVADAGFRAITADLKGHGLSDKPEDPSSYRTPMMVRHVFEILDALNIERCVIGGHSMGAAVAANVALHALHRFSRVILLAPVGMSGFSGIGPIRAFTPRFMRPLLPYLQPRWWYAALLRFVYGRRGRASARDVDEYWAPTQFPQFAKAIRDLLHEHDWGVREPLELSRLTLPVLYMRGTRDRFLWRARAERDIARLPMVRVVHITDAGHTIAEETPEEVGEAVVEFLHGTATSKE